MTIDRMTAAIEQLEQEMPDSAIALLVFPIGSPTGHIHFIGNTTKADMLTAMKEITARWEADVHAGQGTPP